MAAAAVHPHARYHHHIQKPPEGAERWVCIYPAYINKDKTLAEGRRIPKDKAVSSPTCKEIAEVLSTTGLQLFVENKIYCRELSKEPQNWGRIKVQIKNNEKIINSKFSTREDLLLFCAENIPRLKSRNNPKPNQNQQNPQGKQGKGKKKK
ncbi:UNVERIFIED_CONTAM: hypothetical protein RMT77_006366 [Armadillidium vulgare]|uniref:Signal recognition particle protein n=1 Tax=Armadillidium nasatum TaxID=96803 RepID=A0A5N5SID1_9CRUS|nr:Signal recognition particle protein [Armadillidium nasatum]